MRLLIAEDDPRLLRSLAHIFETEGYLVDAVARGDDALAYAESGEKVANTTASCSIS